MTPSSVCVCDKECVMSHAHTHLHTDAHTHWVKRRERERVKKVELVWERESVGALVCFACVCVLCVCVFLGHGQSPWTVRAVYSVQPNIPELAYNPNTHGEVFNQPPAANMIGFNQRANWASKQARVMVRRHKAPPRLIQPRSDGTVFPQEKKKEKDENYTRASFKTEIIVLKYFFISNMALFYWFSFSI